MQTKEGTEVTVRSKEGTEYRRNSSFVKPYNPPREFPEATELASQEATETASQEAPKTLPLEESIATSKPRRTVRMPKKYEDYVL